MSSFQTALWYCHKAIQQNSAAAGLLPSMIQQDTKQDESYQLSWYCHSLYQLYSHHKTLVFRMKGMTVDKVQPGLKTSYYWQKVLVISIFLPWQQLSPVTAEEAISDWIHIFSEIPSDVSFSLIVTTILCLAYLPTNSKLCAHSLWARVCAAASSETNIC